MKFDNKLVEEICESLLTKEQNSYKGLASVSYLEKMLFEYEEKVRTIKKAILIHKLALELKSELIEIDEDIDLSNIEQSEF